MASNPVLPLALGDLGQFALIALSLKTSIHNMESICL